MGKKGISLLKDAWKKRYITVPGSDKGVNIKLKGGIAVGVVWGVLLCEHV